MKKLVIILAVVLATINLASAQSSTSFTKISDSYGVSYSTYSTPKYTNYNTTCKSVNSYLTSQFYSTPKSYTTVSTMRTSYGNCGYISGTDVFSNGSMRSSSRTTSINFGGSRMTTTNFYDSYGKIRSSRTRIKNYTW